MTLGSATILIVEDEAVVALDLKEELQSLGYTVVGIADTAQQAIEQARRHRPALALMDILLKGEMDGVQAAARLRQELGTPVIFLTSFSDHDTVARAARVAAYGYLTKPFQAKELRAGIEIALWKAQMERELRESDRWFALTLRCVQDGVVVVNADGAIRFMNGAAERLLGCSSDLAAGQALDRVLQFDDSPGAAQPVLSDALRQGRVAGVRHARVLRNARGGATTVDESAGPIHDEQGRFLGAVLVLRDVSERLRHEARLRDSEERFRSAFEGAPLGMALVALDGRFLQVNDALCRLLGCTPAWLLAQTQAGVTAPADSAHESARLGELHASPQALTQFEKRYLRPAPDEPVWVLVHASLLRNDGEPTCYLYQVHDLTAQKLAAQQLAELAAERIKREAGELAGRARNEFLSRVSHEMRTPLNAVLGFAELLKLQLATGQPISGSYPQHILAAGKHLLALVDDVLDLQRANDGTLRMTPSPVALDELLPAMLALLQPLAEQRQVSLHSAIEPGLQLHADPTRLRQVLLNLGSNAIKYNVQGGQVLVTAAVVLQADTRCLRLAVQDSGIGMSPGQLEQLFEPFNRLGRETLRVPGTGLGLVITRKLVEQMGGTLHVASQAGKGSVFTLEFALPQPISGL